VAPQPDTLPVPSDGEPLPPPKVIQPEAVQAGFTEGSTKKAQSVIAAGATGDADVPVPEIALQPGPRLESSRQGTAEPAVPQRLPPTQSAQ
jgi:hypothetical protein